METEKFLSGYCRVLDASRLVEILLEDGEITEVDCRYGGCNYQNNCPIATEIENLIITAKKGELIWKTKT